MIRAFLVTIPASLLLFGCVDLAPDPSTDPAAAICTDCGGDDDPGGGTTPPTVTLDLGLATGGLDVTWSDDVPSPVHWQLTRRLQNDDDCRRALPPTADQVIASGSGDPRGYAGDRTGLAMFAQYCYRVSITGSSGQVYNADMCRLTLGSPALQNLRFEPAANQITSTWYDRYLTDDHLTLKRISDSGSATTLSTVATQFADNCQAFSFTDAGLDSLTVYRYQLWAHTQLAGDVLLEDWTAQTLYGKPPAPTITQLTSGSPTSATLGWRDNSNDEDSFLLERCTSTCTTVTTFPSHSGKGYTGSYTDNGLTPSTSYTYKLTARNSAGSATASRSVTTQAPPRPNLAGYPIVLTPTYPRKGNTVYGTWQICNTGAAAATAFDVYTTMTTSTTTNVLKSDVQHVGGLAVGQCYTKQVTGIGGADLVVGWYAWNVYIDVYGAVAETNEGDNQLYYGFQVTP